MTALDAIHDQIDRLYHTQPRIHIHVTLTHPRVSLRNETVLLKGVYPHIFQIEECSSGAPKLRTLQYVDVLTKNIEILELEQ